MKAIAVVGAVIRDGAGLILCALRSDRMSMSGYWEFPGGKIEPGEEPAMSLQREIREELACEITVGALVAATTYAYPSVIVHLQTYHAAIVAGAPTAREHAELRWLTTAALNGLRWAPADLPTVAELQRRLLR